MILAVATELFIANGFEKTTVEVVGKAVGVIKRTIYDHIGDKDTLFHAVCIERLVSSENLIQEVRRGNILSPVVCSVSTVG